MEGGAAQGVASRVEGDGGARGESRGSGVISLDVGPSESSRVKEGLSRRASAMLAVMFSIVTW